MPFWATHKRSSFRRLPIAHVQFTCKCIVPLFAYDGCIRGAYRILVNPTSGDSRPLRGISTKLYLSISTVTVPSWRHGILSEYVSSEHYCQAEVFCSWYMQVVEPLVIASTTYMTIVDLFDEYPAPFSPEMTMTVIDHDAKRILGWPVILNPSKKWRNKGKCHYPALVPSH